jgi:nucleotide-binding universal stress UspA family protein
LNRALHLAHLHSGELSVIHVTNAGLVSSESADAFLALGRRTHHQPNRPVPVRWIMAHGDPAIEVARFIRRTNADLAIVGSALPRPSTRVVGAVAQAILTTTACPVLVIPRTQAEETSPKPYRKILCGVSSGLSTATLRYALSFAQEFEGRLTIQHVKEPDRVHRAGEIWVRTDIDRLRADIPESSRDWCVIDEVVTNGDPAEELVKAAHDREPALVVVGSTGLPGSDGGLGSVALGALTLTNASVLIVPTPAVVQEIDARAEAYEEGEGSIGNGDDRSLIGHRMCRSAQTSPADPDLDLSASPGLQAHFADVGGYR